MIFPFAGCVVITLSISILTPALLLKTAPRMSSLSPLCRNGLSCSCSTKQEGYGMTTYMSHILRNADRAGFPTAAEYDGQFRIQWAERKLPWQIFRGDILFEVEDHIRHQRGSRPFRACGTGSGAFTRHCFRFNKRGGCTKRSCPYSHRCSICRRTNHGAFTCRAADKAIPATHVK